MEIQEVSEVPYVKPKKRVTNPGGNPNWKKGVSANPAGPVKTGMQSFIERATHIARTYSIEDVGKICSKKELFGKLSVFDGMIMMRFYESSLLGGRHSMDSILDRIIGKPDQYVRVDQNNTHTVVLQDLGKELKSLGNDELLAIRQILDTKKEAPITDASYIEIEGES